MSPLHSSFAKKWGVLLPDSPKWTDYFLLIERICEKTNGYFIFKIDGERISKKYTHTLNIPYPIDAVLRKDSDDIFEGMAYIVDEICNLNVEP